MGVRLRAASVRGPAHTEAGMPNQDAVLIRQGRWGWLAAVSDGMGSRPRADIGARTLCKAAFDSVRELHFDCTDRAWVETLECNWLERLGMLRIAAKDAVATCLLAWGLPDSRFRLAQLGDGLILGHPAPARGLLCRDGGSFGNLTRGLGLSWRLEDWRFYSGQLLAPGDALVLMTDGISDDLSSTDGLVSMLARELRNRGARSARAALTRDLTDWPTAHHSDDKTVAIIYRV